MILSQQNHNILMADCKFCIRLLPSRRWISAVPETLKNSTKAHKESCNSLLSSPLCSQLYLGLYPVLFQNCYDQQIKNPSLVCCAPRMVSFFFDTVDKYNFNEKGKDMFPLSGSDQEHSCACLAVSLLFLHNRSFLIKNR